MLEQTTRIVSENLARNMDRRRFLKRMGEALFAGVATMSVGRVTSAFAVAGGQSTQPIVPVCNPPGPYCNVDGVNEPNGCHGSACFQHLYAGQVLQCRLYYAWFPYGCWTNA